MLTSILILLLLIVVNGLFAMSELAIVSARAQRLRMLEAKGSRGAATALRLQEDSGRFLSTVQIGITLIGIVAGAYSGAALGQQVAAALIAIGLPETLANQIAVPGTVAMVTYLSLVIGELVPKQIALRHPESVAATVAGPMSLLSKVAAPLVFILDLSGKLLLMLLGESRELKQSVTDEEVKSVLDEAEEAGTIESEEKAMIGGVMRFADRQAKALMTPRFEVELINLSMSREQLRQQIETTRRSRLPVRDGEEDEIIGVIFVHDLLTAFGRGDDVDLRSLIYDAPVIYENARSLQVLDALRGSNVHTGLVFDEYGHFEGIITATDILEAIAGTFSEEEADEPAVVERADGSFLVSGWMPSDEFRDRFGIDLPDGDYETVAGLSLETLKRLPSVGEVFAIDGWTFEIVDLDGRRVDKLLVTGPKKEDDDKTEEEETTD